MKDISKDQLVEKIFSVDHIDIGELLLALFSHNVSTDIKKFVWSLWKNKYYSFDDITEFFSDTLFKKDGSVTYFDIILSVEDYKNFYQLALTLDMANFDPWVYYTYWILTCGNNTNKKVLADAIEYDGDTILGMFPDIKEVLF